MNKCRLKETIILCMCMCVLGGIIEDIDQDDNNPFLYTKTDENKSTTPIPPTSTTTKRSFDHPSLPSIEPESMNPEVKPKVTWKPMNNTNAIQYHYEGMVIGAMSFADIKITINGTQLAVHTDDLLDTMNKSNFFIETHNGKGFVLEQKAHMLMSSVRLLYRISSATMRRSLWMLGSLFTGFGLGVSFYALGEAGEAHDMAERALIKERIHDSAINKNTNMIITLTNNIKFFKDKMTLERLRDDYFEVMVSTMEYTAANIDAMNNGIEALLQGQLLPSLVDLGSLYETLVDLESEVYEKGYETLAGLTAMDLFQLPHSARNVDGAIVVRIHVPIFDKDTVLQAHSYKNIPWRHKTKNGTDVDVFPILDDDVIAVATNGDYQTMKMTDIEKCPKFRDYHLCGHHRQFYNHQHQSCLHSLYWTNSTSINANCQFRFEKPKAHIEQISPNKFVMNTGPEKTHVQTRCRDDDMDRVELIQGGFLADIPDGCRVDMGTISVRKMPFQIHPRMVRTVFSNITTDMQHLTDAINEMEAGLDQVTTILLKGKHYADMKKMEEELSALMDKDLAALDHINEDDFLKDFDLGTNSIKGRLLDGLILFTVGASVVMLIHYLIKRRKKAQPSRIGNNLAYYSSRCCIGLIFGCCLCGKAPPVEKDDDERPDELEMKVMKSYSHNKKKDDGTPKNHVGREMGVVEKSNGFGVPRGNDMDVTEIHVENPEANKVERLCGAYMKKGYDPKNPEHIYVVHSPSGTAYRINETMNDDEDDFENQSNN